ncbi:MAG: hypothetical protein ACJA1U_000410 [Bermanella sp.]|jgi:hypothetical protein
MSEKSAVDPLLCPLCEQQNHCGNLGAGESEKTCWCNNPDIQFPKALLDQVSVDKKGKACVCQQCARAFSQTDDVSIYIPE